MGTARGIPMEQPGHQTGASPETEMPVKEAMIRTFMFVFVVLVGASVSLTIILLMVLKQTQDSNQKVSKMSYHFITSLNNVQYVRQSLN